ncbi:MAG: DNA polymerase III subunit chi [Pseudomonadota bacterium]
MTEVLFYHLERARLESVLPELLERTLEKGWRAYVCTGAEGGVEALDDHLWTYRDESFLPHGTNGAGHPILISDRQAPKNDAANGADILFIVGGASGDASIIDGYERCVVIFDGRDDAATSDARAFWRTAAENGAAVTYWRQSERGRWEKQS